MGLTKTLQYQYEDHAQTGEKYEHKTHRTKITRMWFLLGEDAKYFHGVVLYCQ